MNRILVVVALVGEGALVAIALSWKHLRGIPLSLGDLWEGVIIGCVAGMAFSLVNWYILCIAPSVHPVTMIRQFHRENLKPLFRDVGVVDIIIISLAAGIGEEILFRGIIQSEVGIVLSSIIFGALHMNGKGALAFGCWVTLMGALLGWLAIWTGGLLAPIICHALYDVMSISYTRFASGHSVTDEAKLCGNSF